jgi:threonine synthase
MLRWQNRLSAEAGIFCEATSAAAFAGLEGMVANGSISEDARVLIPITGSGLKEPLTR